MRLDGDDAADLVLHEHLPVVLQLGVDGGHDVVSRDGFHVHFAVVVGGLYLVVGVAQVYMVAFGAAEFTLPCCLYASPAYVVSRAVLARMLLHVVRIHLGDIAEEVASGVDRVVAYASELSLESGELVLDLGEPHVCLGRDLLDHGLRLVADTRAVLAVIGHPVADELDVHVQCRREGEGVEGLDLARRHDDVVCGLVADEDLPVTVVDDAACGVDGLVDHGVVVGTLLVLVMDDLDGEKLDQKDGGDGPQTYQKLVFPAEVHGLSPGSAGPLGGQYVRDEDREDVAAGQGGGKAYAVEPQRPRARAVGPDVDEQEDGQRHEDGY